MIKCKLHVVDLAHKPSFTALSYVWGDPTAQAVIWLSDEPLRVTKNAWEALNRLRTTFSPLRIWVDAICIDQTNASEKLRQIPLMSEIYSSAERVYIWLGEADKTTTKAMRHLRSGALYRPGRASRTVADLVQSPMDTVESASLVPTGSRMRLWLLFHFWIRKVIFRRKLYLHADLLQLFSRSWIKRVWTLQEVLLARDPVFVCGKETLSWFSFLCAAETLEFYRTGPRRYHLWRTPLITHGLDIPPDFEPWLQLARIWKAWHGHSIDETKPASPPDLTCRSIEDADICVSQQQEAPLLAPGSSHLSQTADAAPRSGIPGTRRTLLDAHAHEIAKVHLSWGARYSRSFSVLICIPLLGIVITIAILTAVGVVSRVALASLPPILFFLIRSILTLGWTYKPRSVSHYERRVPWKLTLMTQIATRECTIREDSYYGVLGIIQSDSLGKSDNIVAASRDRRQAFRSLCLDLIRWHGSLDYLLYLSDHDQPPATPSWVVQWHLADSMWSTYLHRYDLYVEDPVQGAPGTSVERSASGAVAGATPASEPWHFWNWVAGHELRVRAVILDEVTWTIRTNPMERPKGQKRRLYQAMSGCATAQPISLESIKASVLALAALGKSNIIERAIEDRRALVLYHASEVRVFGMAAPNVQIGDYLALISGLSLPMILRRAGSDSRGKYRVVGPVFIPALNEGQAWTEKNKQKLEMIVLV